MKSAMHRFALVLMLILVTAHAAAEKYATTDDGKRVRLNADGSWEYVREEPIEDPNATGSVGSEDLTYVDDLVKVTFQSAFIPSNHSRTRWGKTRWGKTQMKFEVTVVSKTKIIFPFTRDAHQDSITGETYGFPRPFYVKDNYGNRYSVSDIRPYYYSGGIGEGLRPGQTETFKILLTNTPLESASHVDVKIPTGVFGNVRAIDFSIPIGLFEVEREANASSN